MLDRPNPDDLLRRVQDEERRARRGKLTIFFGAAPGVGKTYAMLEAARSERDLKRDVIVGVVETHGRYDTASLLLGLEILPRRTSTHKGVTLTELDVDGALGRRPGVILVDELAHTNAPGSRHEKRWQDVEELLDAGIDVYATLNVQHLESLNDLVAQITGVTVRETVPDAVVERADEVRLVDLPPDELLERLHEGKVYVPEQAKRAVEHFFKKGNLIALRELALRQTAERVDEQMRSYKLAEGIEGAWPVVERILVCVSASPESAKLVRAARRLSTRLKAEWVALYVETPAAARATPAARARVAENLRLAESLGAETATVAGENAADEVLRWAQARNVSKIVVGKPTHPAWRDLLRRSFLERLVRASRGTDVYVIAGEGPEARPSAPLPDARSLVGSTTAALASVASVAACTAIAWFLFGRSELADVVMTYVLGIVLLAMRFGFGPSVIAAMLSVVSLDFFFIPPFYSFAVGDLRHVVTFAVMFFVAIVISRLTRRVHDQADAARGRERRTASLFSLTRELAGAESLDALLRASARHVADVFDANVTILLPGVDGRLAVATQGERVFSPGPRDTGVADWVWSHEKPAGLSTGTLPSASALYVPLFGARAKHGVLGVAPLDPRRFVDPEKTHLLATFASLIASALERTRLAEEAQAARVEAEAERMQSSLLSSVSHDLRTPLAVITGATSSLLSEGHVLAPDARRDLLVTVHQEAQRLTRLVRNLLDMTKLASGALRLTKQWQPLESVVGAALARLDERLGDREVDVSVPAGLPPVPIDAVLVEQLFVNLLENAAKYTPPGSPIAISARAGDGEIVVEVADRGPGVPEDQRERVFEKFVRLSRDAAGGGAGLGLAICRAVVEAHGGRISVYDRDGGGAAFRFTLPLEGTPPTVAP